MTRSLKGKVEKDNYVYINADTAPKKPFAKFQKGQKAEKQVWTTNLVQRPADPTPAKKIVRANFTGLTDEDLFGPDFLHEEPELFVEKKSIPIHTNQRRYAYSPRENYYDDGDYEEDTHKQTMECFECGSTFPHDEECPDCEVPPSSEEENHSSIKEGTPETREYMKQEKPRKKTGGND